MAPKNELSFKVRHFTGNPHLTTMPQSSTFLIGSYRDGKWVCACDRPPAWRVVSKEGPTKGQRCKSQPHSSNSENDEAYLPHSQSSDATRQAPSHNAASSSGKSTKPRLAIRSPAAHAHPASRPHRSAPPTALAPYLHPLPVTLGGPVDSPLLGRRHRQQRPVGF